MIKITTNLGAITLKLAHDKVPATCSNFTHYVKEGFFTNLLFHRVIDNFMIQGGGMTTDFEEKRSHKPIENEADKGLKNKTGTISMARTSDPHSATTQFFINLKDNDFLDHKSKSSQGWGYCAFGEVIDGMDVVNKIAKVKTGRRQGHDDVPVDNVIIESITMVPEL